MISDRIKKLAFLAKDSYKVCDVGCDHGYLVIELFNNYGLNKAVLIDNKQMPLDSARKNILAFASSKKEEVRYSLSRGINDVDSDSDTIVIAGMGGILIKNILEDGFKTNGKPYYEKMKFILQANRNVSDLRFYLNNNGFYIEDEEVIHEDGKYYEIIVCYMKNDVSPLTYSEIEFGPILLKKKGEIFVNKYKEEIQKLEKINCDNLKDKIERIKKICL